MIRQIAIEMVLCERAFNMNTVQNLQHETLVAFEQLFMASYILFKILKNDVASLNVVTS